MHHETFVKVNARVDRNIAELVSALSEIDGLETIESCEGDPERKPAFVIFRYGSWRDCGEFLFDKMLTAMDADLRADVSLSLVGYDSADCLGRISLPPEAVGPITRVVRSVRTCACSDDMRRT